jgi:hypothetical protein
MFSKTLAAQLFLQQNPIFLSTFSGFKPTTPSVSKSFTARAPSERTRNFESSLQKAIELVSPASKGFHSQLFTIPKKTGDRRHVLNLRPLN